MSTSTPLNTMLISRPNETEDRHCAQGEPIKHAELLAAFCSRRGRLNSSDVALSPLLFVLAPWKTPIKHLSPCALEVSVCSRLKCGARNYLSFSMQLGMESIASRLIPSFHTAAEDFSLLLVIRLVGSQVCISGSIYRVGGTSMLLCTVPSASRRVGSPGSPIAECRGN